MPNSSAVGPVAGQECAPSWRAGWGDVIIAQRSRFGKKFVDVGCLDYWVAIAPKISVALIVREDNDNIGSVVCIQREAKAENG